MLIDVAKNAFAFVTTDRLATVLITRTHVIIGIIDRELSKPLHIAAVYKTPSRLPYWLSKLRDML